jgi:hypothetical protein
MSKSSWMMDPIHSREMPRCLAIDLAKIRLAVFQDSLVNLINNLWGSHCFGSSGMRCITGGKVTRLNLVTQFFMVAYDGACSPNVYIRMAWISFSALPCKKKNLMTACVSMLLKLRASPDMVPFSLYNKKRLAIQHMNRPVYRTTLSIPFYDIRK